MLNYSNTKVYIKNNNNEIITYDMKYIYNFCGDLLFIDSDSQIVENNENKLFYVKKSGESIVDIPFEYCPQNKKKYLKIGDLNNYLNYVMIYGNDGAMNFQQPTTEGLISTNPQITSGKYKIVPIFVRYSNDKYDFENAKKKLHKMINEDVNKYFLKISKGNLDITSTTIQIVNYPLNFEEVTSIMYFDFLRDIIKNGLIAIDNELQNIELNDNGEIPFVMVFHLHEKAYQKYYNNESKISNRPLNINNKIYYLGYCLYDTFDDNSLGNIIKNICISFLSYKHIYADYMQHNNCLIDIGCIMAKGSELMIPPEPCAYFKYLSKFINPTKIVYGIDKDYIINDESLIYCKDESEKEGFIFEIRGKSEYDKEIFGGDKMLKLAIYHYDLKGLNHFDLCSEKYHYGVMLEEANNDGRKQKIYDLLKEKTKYIPSTKGFFSKGDKWGVNGISCGNIKNTNINSKWWDGTSSDITIEYLGKDKIKVFFQKK